MLIYEMFYYEQKEITICENKFHYIDKIFFLEDKLKFSIIIKHFINVSVIK